MRSSSRSTARRARRPRRSTPSTTTPGGTLTRRFASITGTTALGRRVDDVQPVDPATRRGRRLRYSMQTRAPRRLPSRTRRRARRGRRPTCATPSGVVTTDVTANDHTLSVRSLAVQDAVSDLTHPGAPRPDDSLQHTLSTQISDFFAFDGVQVTDTHLRRAARGRHLLADDQLPAERRDDVRDTRPRPTSRSSRTPTERPTSPSTSRPSCSPAASPAARCSAAAFRTPVSRRRTAP